jgi:hypothetical protein
MEEVNVVSVFLRATVKTVEATDVAEVAEVTGIMQKAVLAGRQTVHRGNPVLMAFVKTTNNFNRITLVTED